MLISPRRYAAPRYALRAMTLITARGDMLLPVLPRHYVILSIFHDLYADFFAITPRCRRYFVICCRYAYCALLILPFSLDTIDVFAAA